MSIFKQWLNEIEPYKPGKPIEEVRRSLGLKEVYKLASNEIPFAPLYIRGAIKKELLNINRYPEGDCFYLRNLLAKKLKVNTDEIVFGNGSDELIVLTLRAAIEKNDEVIVAYPTFLIYEIQARVEGATVVRLPLKNLRYDLDAISARVSPRTKVIFIANPNNPTGTYVTHREVYTFLKRIPKNILVYFDEAYFEFAPRDFPRTLEFLRQRGNIIISRTFSKAFGLAGLRIGYAVTAKEIASILNRIREPFNINRFAQVAACAALRNRQFLKKVMRHVKLEKEYLYRGLKRCRLSFIKSATNFILVDFKRNTNHLANYLLQKGVIIRGLEDWGLKDFFRLTVGTHRENEKFVEFLKEYLEVESSC